MPIDLSQIEDKFAKLAQIRVAVIATFQELEGPEKEHFDFSIPIPGLNCTLAELDTRIAAICEIAKFDPGEKELVLVPQTITNNLIKQLDHILSHYQSIEDQFANITNNGGVGGLNPGSFGLRSKNGQVSLDLSSLLQSVWKQSEGLISALFALLNIINGKGYTDFSGAFSSYSKALEEIEKRHTRLAEIERDATGNAQNVKALQSQSAPLKDEIERLKTEAEKDRKSLGEYASEGTQSITKIRSTTEDAEQLKSLVDEYAATFENFQKRLDQREKVIAQGNAAQEELMKGLQKLELQIQDLNARAEAMLSGATVAGLAGSFGDIRDDLFTELEYARKAFYLAIFLLGVSVLPLAIYVIPGLGEWLSLTTVATHVQSASVPELIGNIIARALLLLPAAWFAKFAAGRHADLFKLKEHYAYKYSVASSVDAFKKQAEPYKDEIAAATFFELTFNPAERMGVKGSAERHPNRAMDWVMGKLGATYDGKSD